MTEPDDIPAPTTREELTALLIDANTQLALQIVRRIRAGDVGSASWLKEARCFLRDQGIDLQSMKPSPTEGGEALREKARLLGADFAPGVYHDL
jgi:hypothetical protein